MSYIQELRLRNVAGKTGVYRLEPFTAIIGPNRSHKTTLANAANLLLAGFLPSLGKKPGATFDLAGAKGGATDMEITGTLSDGKSILRGWKMDGKGGVSVVGQREPLVTPVMIDVREFTQLSGPEQVRFMFRKLDLDAIGFTEDGVRSAIEKGYTTPSTEKAEEIKRDVMDVLECASEEAKAKGLAKDGWLEAVNEALKARELTAKRSFQAAEGSIRTANELRAAQGLRAKAKPFDPNRLTKVRNELAEANAVKRQLDAQAQKAAAHSTPDTQAIQAEIERIGAESKTRREQADKIKEAIDGHNAQATAQLSLTLQGCLAKEAEIKGLIQGRDNEAAKVQRSADDLCGDIAELNGEAEELKKQADEASKAKCCPTCGGKGMKWRDDRVAQLLKEAELKKQQAKTLEGKVSELLKNRDAILLEKEPMQASLEEAKKKTAEAKSSVDTSKSFDEQHYARLSQHSGIMAILSSNASAITRLTQKLADAQREAPLPPNADDVATNKAHIERLTKEQTELMALEREDIARKSEERRIQEAEESYEKARLEKEIFSEALASVQNLRVNLMEKAFGYFLNKINLFTEGVMPPLNYRDGSIGYFLDAQWVKLSTFSGVEKMLTLSGLAVALAQECEHKVIIFDEMGVVDPATKNILIGVFKSLISTKQVDQIICIEPTGEAYFGEHIIDMAA